VPENIKQHAQLKRCLQPYHSMDAMAAPTTEIFQSRIQMHRYKASYKKLITTIISVGIRR
jgi:hypothetical protein